MNDKPEQLDTSCQWVACSPAWIEAGGDCATAPRVLCGHGQGISHMHPAHQGYPVTLPARKSYEESFSVHGQGHIQGWNACLDELAKLGPLYTHADPAEVERLRAELVEWKERCQRNSDEAMSWMSKHDTLRAQMAERDALLLRAVNGARFTLPDQWHKDYVALSASAEPSAPAEHERR